jgi:hypothetical protein
MIRFAKIILPAKLNGLALGLLQLSAPASQPGSTPSAQVLAPASFQLASSMNFAFIFP